MNVPSRSGLLTQSPVPLVLEAVSGVHVFSPSCAISGGPSRIAGSAVKSSLRSHAVRPQVLLSWYPAPAPLCNNGVDDDVDLGVASGVDLAPSNCTDP